MERWIDQKREIDRLIKMQIDRDRWINGEISRQNGSMDWQMDRQIVRQLDRQIDSDKLIENRDTQIDIDRQIQIDRQIDKWTEGYMERQVDRYTCSSVDHEELLPGKLGRLGRHVTGLVALQVVLGGRQSEVPRQVDRQIV